MNYTIISDNLIVGSQPQKPEDVEYLKEEEKVAYILCLQQDKDIEYWGIDIQAIVGKCKELGILHMRRPVSLCFFHLFYIMNEKVFSIVSHLAHGTNDFSLYMINLKKLPLVCYLDLSEVEASIYVLPFQTMNIIYLKFYFSLIHIMEFLAISWIFR